MECKSPILVGKVRHLQRLVPCGKCAQCKANLRAEWCGRLSVENYFSKRSYFVTLTYDDDHILANKYGVPSVWKEHIQKLFKRLRKSISCRYFCTSEYGSKTFRPHYHILFFTNEDITDQDFYDLLDKQWFYGSVHYGIVEPASIAYCTKYCMKDSKILPEANKPFRLMSRFPPLGSQIDYDENMLGSFDFYGQRFKTSRLYRDKFISSHEDLAEDLKAFQEQRAAQRAEAAYSKWCLRFNKQKSIETRIEYGLWQKARKQREHELHLQHIKQEIL